MAALPENMSLAIDELETAIAEMESRLESARAERDDAKARQIELEIENANLRRELALAREHQTASADILSSIAGTPADVDQSLLRIAETTARLFGAPSVTISVAAGDEWGKRIHFGATSQRIRDEAPAEQRGLTGANLSAVVYRENRQIHIPDLDNVDPAMAHWPVVAARVDGTRTVSCTPLRREGKAIGALLIYRDGFAPFTDEELALQQSFADQAVIAIENARLFNETREALERQTATADILKVIASSPSDAQPVFDTIAESARRLSGGPTSIVTQVIGDFLHLRASSADSEAGAEELRAAFPIPLSANRLHGRAALSGEIAFRYDTENEPGVSLIAKETARVRGYRSLLAIPMMREGIAIGTIGVSRREAGHFPDKFIELLRTFADQAVIAIENARLIRETQQALERQTATAEVLKVIASSPSDVQPVFEAIASSAKRLLGAFSTTVLRFIDDELHLVAYTPTSPEADETLASSFPRKLAEFPTFALVRNGETIQFADTEAEAVPEENRELARLRGFRSVLFTPLMNRGTPVGIISVTRAEPGVFAPHHVQLLQTFADQAVIAIENTRLFNETQEALERQTATAEILKVIASSPSDVQPVFDAIASSANRLLGGFSTAVYRFADDFVHLVAFTPTGPEADAALIAEFPVHFDKAAPPVARVINGEPVVIADSEAADPQSARIARARGWRSVMFTPLMNKGGAIGFITVTRRETGKFDDHHVQLLQTFADQAVIAIENTRLFNETQEALERQTATAEILRVIAGSPSDTTPVFEAIATSANRLLGGFSTAVFRFVDGAAQLAAFTPTNPAADDILRASFPRPVDDFEAFRLAQHGKPIPITDTEDMLHAQIREIARLRGFRSMLFVPLMNGSVPIGIISVTRLETGSFAPHHVQLLQTFADQAVIAIENTRLFNETKEALERQTATADILKVIASSPSDVQPVFDAIAASGHRLLGGFSTSVFSIIDDMLHLSAFTPTNPVADAALKASFPRPASAESWNSTVLNGETVEIPDVEADPMVPENLREMWRKRGFRSLLLVPLVRSGTTIGMINTTRVEPGRFSSHHVQLLQTFADQAVIAIENTRLFNETREALQRQTATAEILKVIASSPSDTTPVFDAIVHSANRLIDGFSTAVFRYSDGKIHLAAFTPTDAEGDAVLQSSFPVPLEAFPPYHLTLDGAPAELPDTETEPAARDIARARGYRSMLFAPLMNDGVAAGIITVTRVAPGPFGEQHTRLLQMFADQAVIAIKNVGLFNEVQTRTVELTESLEQQTATSEVLRVISSSAGDLAPVFDTMLRKAMELCGANFGTLNTFDGTRFHTAATYGLPPAYDEYRRKQPLQYGPGTAPALLMQGEPFVEITDLLESEPYRQGEPNRRALVNLGGARCLLAVPLLKDGRVTGNVMIFRQENRRFSEKQITLLKQFAAQAVIAIENTRLLNELHQRTNDLSEALTYQTGSANILKVIASSPTDIKPVLNAIVESACELCGAYDAVLRLKKGDELEIGAHHGTVPADWNLSQINPRWTAGRAAIEQSPVHVHDMSSSEGDEFPEAQARARDQGHRTILSVPLLQEGNSVGTLTLRRLEVDPFSDKQIALLQTFADQAVIAIGNVRLFEEVQQRTQELSESLQFQTASSEVLKVISSSPDALQPVLDAIVQTSLELCGSDGATIVLFRERKAHFVAVAGVLPQHFEHLRDNPASIDDPGSLFDRMTREKRTLHFPNVMDDPEISRHPRIAMGGPRALLVTPLLRDGEAVGAIVLRQSHLKPFTPRQVQAIQVFADQAVIAISNVELFEQVQQRTRELSKSLDDLRTAQDRLVQTEKLASLGQLTAGIAHEIKNPLNFVNNFAALSAELTVELNEVLKPAGIGDKMRTEVNELTALLKDNLEKVVQHGKRADSIVKNMLLHSREGGGEHRPSDINALIDESLNLAYHGARAEKPDFNITLERDFDPEAGQVDLFPQEITRVFLNLVSNGFYAVTKRRKEGGASGFEPTLRASTKSLGEAVEIRIRDNGTGIPAEVKEKMFNPFFTTKPAGEGTGLGLSMSHDIIVKQHGGTIDVDTQSGHFTEFRIVLPRTSNFADKSRG